MWKRYKAITMPPSLLNWMTDVVYNPNCFCKRTIIAAYWCRRQQQDWLSLQKDSRAPLSNIYQHLSGICNLLITRWQVSFITPTDILASGCHTLRHGVSSDFMKCCLSPFQIRFTCHWKTQLEKNFQGVTKTHFFKQTKQHLAYAYILTYFKLCMVFK